MTAEEKTMYKELLKSAAITLLLLLATVGILFLVMHCIFKAPLAVTAPSLFFGIAGTVLGFIGGIFSNDAVTRWGATTLPQWRWGNRIQMIGFAMLIIALLFK